MRIITFDKRQFKQQADLALDLYEFFGNQGLDRLLQLALAIGGQNGSSARLALDIQPRVMTPLGEIKYPDRLTIIDREFR